MIDEPLALLAEAFGQDPEPSTQSVAEPAPMSGVAGPLPIAPCAVALNEIEDAPHV